MSWRQDFELPKKKKIIEKYWVKIQAKGVAIFPIDSQEIASSQNAQTEDQVSFYKIYSLKNFNSSKI